MTLYDTTFILNPQLEESGLDERVKQVIELINSHGGKVTKENRMGMRRLAYEIQKMTQGYYVNLVFEGSGDTVKELEHRFRLDENCMRFLTCLYKEVPEKTISSRSPRDDDDRDSNHDFGDRDRNRGFGDRERKRDFGDRLRPRIDED
ncbi:MAG: 30S ribosomal protein S6 [Candidatus Zixiibacteriota bacterium]